MQVQGDTGELRYGYAVAGRLRRWRLTPVSDVIGSDECVVRGDLTLDPFLSRQRPLSLTLLVGRLVWTWDDARVEDGHLVIAGAPVEGVRVLHGT